jgi:hypothetical protein
VSLAAVVSLVLLAAAAVVAALVLAATYGGNADERGDSPAALASLG